MFFKLFLFFQMITFILADVTLYKYQKSSIISINNNRFRETIDSKYFAYPGFHKLDNTLNYTTSYFNSNKYYFGTNINKDYVITKPTLIGNIKYYSDSKHIFHYILNVILSDQGTITLFHNRKPIIIFNNMKVSYYNHIFLDKGQHTFDLEVNGNRICNCPSFKDGYQQTRYFFGWINKKEDKKNYTNLVNNIKIQLNITHSDTITKWFTSSVGKTIYY